MELIGLLIVIAILVFVFALGAVSMDCAYRLRDGRHETAHAVNRYLLRVFGVASIALSVAGALVTVVAAVNAIWEEARFRIVPAEAFFAAIGAVGAAFLVCGFFVLVGRRMLDAADSVGKPLTVEEQDALNRKLAFLTTVGGTIVVLYVIAIAIAGCVVVAAGLLPVLGIFGLLVLIVLAVASAALAGHYHRSRQARLLWLLAIAVRRGMSLPEEIEAHARAVMPPYWAYRYQPWRLLLLPWRRQYQDRLLGLAERLREGVSLADALSVRFGLVPQAAVAAARVGTETATLGDALEQAAVRHTQGMQYPVATPSPSSFLLYLCAVLIIMTLIVWFQMYYIVPKLKKIFSDFGMELPGLTVALIEVSDVFIQYFPLFLIPIGIGVYALVLLALGCYRGWEEFKIPWLVRWFPRADTPGILRSLRRAVITGKPLSDALVSLATHHHRIPTRERLHDACAAVNAGTDCWQSLNDVGLLNRPERALLQAAQRAGNLPWALEELADSIERRRQYRLICWFEMLRPILVFLIAAFVGFVIVALFLPIVKLVNDLS